MIIVHVIEATFAGVGRHVLDLAGAQAKVGHDVHVVYSSTRESESFRYEREQNTSVTWHAVAVDRSPSARDFGAIRQINSLIRSIGPDVVHGHSTKGGMLARLCRSRGATIAYTPNALYTMSPGLGKNTHRMVSLLERALSKRTGVFIAVSPEERDHAQAIGLRPRSFALIPNGIEVPERVDMEEVRAALGVEVEPDGVLLGFVGRLDEQKAPERLIEILEAVQESEPAAQLLIVGDGPDRPALENLVRDRRVQGVTFAGTQPGTWAMCAFDVFVLPSRYEGFPYVLIEAAHLGIPIVASHESNSSYLAEKYGRIQHALGDDTSAFACAVGALGDQFEGASSDLSEFTASEMSRSVERAYLQLAKARA